MLAVGATRWPSTPHSLPVPTSLAACVGCGQGEEHAAVPDAEPSPERDAAVGQAVVCALHMSRKIPSAAHTRHMSAVST